MNQKTIDKLSENPHYKFTHGTPPIPEEETEEEPVKTWGVLPKQNTFTVPKHPTKPKTKTNKKIIEKQVA